MRRHSGALVAGAFGSAALPWLFRPVLPEAVRTRFTLRAIFPLLFIHKVIG